MDRTEHRSAQIIPFPAGGRDAARRLVAGVPSELTARAAVRVEVDCSAWYHQAAMQDAAAPRRP